MNSGSPINGEMNENYTEQFHNLGGATLGEHHRNFRKFLENISGLQDAEITGLLQGIGPKNHQEEIFYTKLLLHFQQYEQVLDIFDGCNKILNRIIVKDRKFIGFVASRGAQRFVDELCPIISYVDRSVLINKLGLFLEDGHDFYNAVKEKYGLAAAIRLLPTCEEDIIMKEVLSYHIDLSDRELIKLHKKYPTFLMGYFQENDKQVNSKVKLIKYLVNNDMDTLMRITSDFPSCFLGKKGFFKLMRHNRAFIIKHPHEFNSHISRIYRCLDVKDYRLFMENLFPRNIQNLYCMDTVLRSLKMLPIHERWLEFNDIYYNKYGIRFMQFNSNLMEMISAKDRLRFDLVDHWEFYPLDEAFTKIIYRIDLAHDINNRSTLLHTLVKACNINRNNNALLDVLKYFCAKHKNDTIEVRKNFLRSLSSNVNLLKLSVEHWKYINEILLIFEINGDSYYDIATFLKAEIFLKTKKDFNCDKELVKLLKEIGVNGNWRLLKNHPVQERKCLLRYPSLWHKANFMQDGSPSVKFLETISDFNKNYPNHKISYYAFETTLNSFFEQSNDLKSHAHLINTILCFIPKESKEAELRERLLKDLISNHKNFITETLYVWMLKYRPEWICKEASDILLKAKQLPKFHYEISKMHYNGVSQVFKDAAMKIIDDPKQIEMVPKLLFSLSYYQNYFELIKKYAPDAVCKIDVYSSDIKIVLKIQKTILKSLKNTYKQSDNIPTILHYANEDYLQYALEAMYRTFYHTPGDLLGESLKTISTRSVSVRKHYIYLSTVLLPISEIEECLKECGSKEKNTSVKKFLFKCNHSCFINNPTKGLFELFQTHLQLVDEKDEETREMIFQINGIPKKYLVEYVQLLWSYAKTLTDNEKFRIPSYLTKDNMKLFPHKFCKEVIEECLFNPDNKYAFVIPSFVYNYIMRKPNAAKVVIEKIGRSIRKVERYVSISLFVEICQNLLKDRNDSRAADVSRQLLDALQKGSFRNFEFEVLLRFVTHYLQNSDHKLLHKFIIEELQKFIESYGPEICVHYSRMTLKALEIIHKPLDEDKICLNHSLILNMLQLSSSTHVKLLSAFILTPLPKNNMYYYKAIYDTITTMLLKDSNPLIKIFLDCNISTFG